ncbi:hypothetical protein [Streptomyces sp. NPDC089799]|uniref:hypothetical protein n=1 Tax=Streptomyces sp. NPDC089799 TaxID=3155066 RepID=UPI0034308E1E
MSILNPKASRKDVSAAADPSLALLPLVALMPALTAMYADGLGTATQVALVVAELALFAVAGARAAASFAATRTAADRAPQANPRP